MFRRLSCAIFREPKVILAKLFTYSTKYFNVFILLPHTLFYRFYFVTSVIKILTTGITFLYILAAYILF
jgi:hypothetical protein